MSGTTHADLMKYFKLKPFDTNLCYSSCDELLDNAATYGANEKELEQMRIWYDAYYSYSDYNCDDFSLIDRLKGEWRGHAIGRVVHYGLKLKKSAGDVKQDNFEDEVFRKMILADHRQHNPCNCIEFGALDDICETILRFSKKMKKRGAKVGDIYEDHKDLYDAMYYLNLMANRGELDPDLYYAGECRCFKLDKKNRETATATIQSWWRKIQVSKNNCPN